MPFPRVLSDRKFKFTGAVSSKFSSLVASNNSKFQALVLNTSLGAHKMLMHRKLCLLGFWCYKLA